MGRVAGTEAVADPLGAQLEGFRMLLREHPGRRGPVGGYPDNAEPGGDGMTLTRQ